MQPDSISRPDSISARALEMWGSQVRLANPAFSSKQLWAFDTEAVLTKSSLWHALLGPQAVSPAASQQGVLVCKAGHDDDGSRILNAGTGSVPLLTVVVTVVYKESGEGISSSHFVCVGPFRVNKAVLGVCHLALLAHPCSHHPCLVSHSVWLRLVLSQYS